MNFHDGLKVGSEQEMLGSVGRWLCHAKEFVLCSIVRKLSVIFEHGNNIGLYNMNLFRKEYWAVSTLEVSGGRVTINRNVAWKFEMLDIGFSRPSREERLKSWGWKQHLFVLAFCSTQVEWIQKFSYLWQLPCIFDKWKVP